MAGANRSELPKRFALGIVHTWQRLNFEQRVAALGATLLIVSTFGPFSFVEGAIVLTGLSILLLLRRRAEGREFHIPFGDGTMVAAAGVWSAVLILVRLFERPLGQGLLALCCSALLIFARLRERAKRLPDDLPIDPRHHQRGPRAVVDDDDEVPDWEGGRPAADLPPRRRRRSRRPRRRAPTDLGPLDPDPPPEFRVSAPGPVEPPDTPVGSHGDAAAPGSVHDDAGIADQTAETQTEAIEDRSRRRPARRTPPPGGPPSSQTEPLWRTDEQEPGNDAPTERMRPRRGRRARP